MITDIDAFSCRWVAKLMDKGLLLKDRVIQSDIRNLSAGTIMETSHFFAGIGGWPLALQQANWPAIPVWTGSCPCQPFSVSGLKEGFSDARDLWPTWATLINQFLPTIIFGEQVANGLGQEWWSRTCADLQAMGYITAGCVFSASMVGAPHQRKRLYWCGILPDKLMGYADSLHIWRDSGTGLSTEGEVRNVSNSDIINPSSTNDYWENYEWVLSYDGKARKFEPGIYPVADGVPKQLELLKGYGNAIVPQAATLFIRNVLSYMKEVTK